MTPLRFAPHDPGPQTTDHVSPLASVRLGAEAGGVGESAFLRAMALLALAVLLAACGGSEEATNRDRLPRRPPPGVEAPVTPDPGETPGYQPAPVHDGLFTSFGDYERRRAAAVSDLEGAIGTPRASRATSCKKLPVGEKACGGPKGFVVYSATGDAELDIIRRAARVTALDREANEQFGLNSDCALLTAPEVAVENGICVAR